MFRGSVKSTGYPLHSPVSPSLLLPCVSLCHHISTGFLIFLQRKLNVSVKHLLRRFVWSGALLEIHTTWIGLFHFAVDIVYPPAAKRKKTHPQGERIASAVFGAASSQTLNTSSILVSSLFLVRFLFSHPVSSHALVCGQSDKIRQRVTYCILYKLIHQSITQLFNVNKNPTDAVPIRPRWKGVAVQVVWPVPEAAGTVFNTPDDGCCDTRNM